MAIDARLAGYRGVDRFRVRGMLPTASSKRAAVEGIFHAGRELRADMFEDRYLGEGENGPMSFSGYFPDPKTRENAKERLQHMAAMHESPYTDPDVQALIDYYLDRAPISGNDTINTAYGILLNLRDLALCVFPGYREEWSAVRRLRRGDIEEEESREPALLRRQAPDPAAIAYFAEHSPEDDGTVRRFLEQRR